MAKVILKFKEAEIREIPLEKQVTTIGRGEGNDIRIDNMAVSGTHARLINDGERFFIEDLNSTNGTFVNDRHVSRAPLANNAVITIGKHALLFIDPLRDGEDPDETMCARPKAIDKTVIIDTTRSRPVQEKVGRRGEDLFVGKKNGFLIVVKGTADKQEYELTRRVSTIGKAENAEIRLKGFFAPKIAMLVNRTNDGYFINPSAGGKKPLVNGQPLTGTYELKNFDIVEVGSLKLQFSYKE